MTLKKLFFIFVVGLFVSSSLAHNASADLGISPPYVRNPGLAPGSRMEQTIFIVRSVAEEDLEAKIEFHVPGASSWFSIDKGNKFILPKGETKVPITVSINVPAQANFGRYRGNIKLLTNSLREPEGGQVALAFGALIDVDINVVAMKIVNYNVRGIKVYDTEEDYKFLFLNPPSVVRFAMQIENRGNVKSSPTKILLTLYNNDKTEILHTIETTRVPKVDPFKTEWVTARMPAYLKAGSYQAFYQIFRDDQVIQEGETHLSVNPRGTVTDYEDPTFFDLSAADKIKVVAVVIILCAMVFFIVFGIVKAVKGKQATEEVKEKKPVIRKTTKKRVVKRKTKKQE